MCDSSSTWPRIFDLQDEGPRVAPLPRSADTCREFLSDGPFPPFLFFTGASFPWLPFLFGLVNRTLITLDFFFGPAVVR